MSRTVTIVTPENITVTYQVAGFASRFLAFVVDLLLQLLLLLLLALTLRLIVGSERGGVNAGSILSGVGYVISYLILVVYAIFFEMLWGGRTPGKRLLGLRVVRDGGYPVNLFASATRNLLRFIDLGIIPFSMPIVLWGLPGLLAIFFSPQYKRIGDYAAGTLVIVEAGATPFGTRRGATALSAAAAAWLPYVRNVDRLTSEEYRAVRRFTARRDELELVVQASIGERLALPLLRKLEIEAPIAYQVQYAYLLEAIESRYAEERGIL